MWNKLRARHYSVLILLAIVTLETSAIAIDRFMSSRQDDVAFHLDGEFQNNCFVQEYLAPEPVGKGPVVAQAEPVKKMRGAATRESVARKDTAKINAVATVDAGFVAASREMPKNVGFVEYSVRKGDSLVGIASRFGLQPDSLAKVNQLVDKHVIRVGQTLRVPVERANIEYSVQAGDSLSKIAGRFGVSLAEIVEANNLKSFRLTAQQKLAIPVQQKKQNLDSASPVATVNDMRAGNLKLIRSAQTTEAGNLTKVATQPELKIIRTSPEMRTSLVSQRPTTVVAAGNAKEAAAAVQLADNDSSGCLSVTQTTMQTSAQTSARASTQASTQTFTQAPALVANAVQNSTGRSSPAETPRASIALALSCAPAETLVNVAAPIVAGDTGKNAPISAQLAAANNNTAAISSERAAFEQAQTHVVVAGDTLSTIARRFNTTVASLMQVNKLEGSHIRIGQTLAVHPNEQVYRVVNVESGRRASVTHSTAPEKTTAEAEVAMIDYTVKSGDCLSLLARHHNTTVAQIVATNKLNQTNLLVGQKLVIPANKRLYKVSNVTSRRAQPSWNWPVAKKFKIGGQYGWRKHPVFRRRLFHAGVDIPAPKGSSIYASNSGEVIYSGWQRGYGRLVILRHANGYTTRYGHCSSLLVKKGQKVRAGQAIGKVGATGVATGNHLHFEIRRNGKTLNPATLLAS